MAICHYFMLFAAAMVLTVHVDAAISIASSKRRNADRSNVTPLQKLVEMLDGMVAKGKTDKVAEATEFAKFHEWCDGMRTEKETSIAEAAEQMEQLEADINKANADAEVLAGEIKELEATVAKAEEELAAATAVREKELADYTAQAADFKESISACARAIDTLKARTADVPQSLMQVKNRPAVDAYARAVISSFLAVSTEAGAPEANAYEFQSGGVVSMLEKLEAKFKAQLLTLDKAEMNAKANFQLLKQQLTDNIKQDNKDISEKTELKASRIEDSVQAKDELESTTKTKADDEKVLADTKAECLARAHEFEQNQVTRAEEIRAIEEATKILSSDAVKGNAETYLPTFLQVYAAHHSLAQASSARLDPAVRQRVLAFLQGRAHKLSSKYLALAAARVAADPFAKVKKMIKDLIVKLMEETNAEADEHAYCTTELATNKETRNNKAAEAEELAATVEKLTAESARLSEEIAELTKAIAEIKEKQEEATKIRLEEKATNAKTVADAKDAAAAVEKATQVLKDFYAKAADSAFLQGGQESQMGDKLVSDMAATAKAPYKGMQASSGGIFGMLEVVLSDFTRLEAQTLSDEESAASTYDKFMDETNESVAVKEAEVEHKTGNKQRADETNEATKKELALTQAELDKALEYYDKLKEQCVDTGLSYEERKEAREEEIQSLKEALQMLEASDVE